MQKQPKPTFQVTVNSPPTSDIITEKQEGDGFPIPIPPRKKVHCSPYFQFSKLSQSMPDPKELRRISLDELRKHKDADSAWISIKGTVYDVTRYLEYHPGGEIIMTGCGTDATQLFNKFHGYINVEFMLQKYKLGVLEKSKRALLSVPQ